MIQIKHSCIENAVGMLRSKPEYFIGEMGDLRFYVVDGVTWSYSPFNRSVSRSECDDEAESIRKCVLYLNRKEVK